MAIQDIAFNEANREALRPHIGVIVKLAQEHAGEAQVTEAGLATVVCTICNTNCFDASVNATLSLYIERTCSIIL